MVTYLKKMEIALEEKWGGGNTPVLIYSIFP